MNVYTPQENGVSERMNRTLVEMARCLLHDAGLPDSFWGYAVLHSARILNVLPSRALKRHITPEEAFTGNKPSLAQLRIFGCTAYAHIPKEKRQKLDVKTLQCIYIGYAENRKAYRLYHKPTRRVFESRNVTFDEGAGIVPSRITIETGLPSTTSGSPPMTEGPVEQITEEASVPGKEDAPQQADPMAVVPATCTRTTPLCAYTTSACS